MPDIERWRAPALAHVHLYLNYNLNIIFIIFVHETCNCLLFFSSFLQIKRSTNQHTRKQAAEQWRAHCRMVQFLIKIYIAYLYHVLGKAIQPCIQFRLHTAHSNRRGFAANVQTHEIKIESVLKWPMLVAAWACVIFFCNFWNILFHKLCEMPATRCSSAWMLITIFYLNNVSRI